MLVTYKVSKFMDNRPKHGANLNPTSLAKNYIHQYCLVSHRYVLV